MNFGAGFLYSLLFFGVISVNKYVLTVLGFKYPTIYQGWQTLAGLGIYKVLNVVNGSKYPLVALDRVGFISMLPGMLFHTTSLISNSKALTNLPVIVFIAVHNMLPAGVYMLDKVLTNRFTLLPSFCAFITLVTGLGLVLGETDLNFPESAYFWLLVGLVCNGASMFHAGISDARFKCWDRLYYTAVFSVITLAPASLYLEEAFLALKFRNDRQELFLAGCLMSAVLTASLHLYTLVIKTDTSFGLIQHLASCCTGLVSTLLFPEELQPWQQVLVGLNLLSTLALPFHQSREEEPNLARTVQNP